MVVWDAVAAALEYVARPVLMLLPVEAAAGQLVLVVVAVQSAAQLQYR
jgi:hypothetical protein